MRNGDASRSGQRGFGYLLVLFALAAMGLLLAGTGEVWHTAQLRENEAELLFIGNQFRLALASYQKVTPEAAPQNPLQLEELLEDRRFVVPRRHLRKLYRDPMTGKAQWGLVKASGRIIGVHSLSDGRPLKSFFSESNAIFEGAVRYDQWVFSPNTTADAPTAPAIARSSNSP
jgi:type II secretory pathway pseudopilin PulG